MSIKPVAWRRARFPQGTREYSYGTTKLWKDDLPLYAIPDTHRVVSVELLERLLQENYLHPDESDTCIEFVAIIEDKP